MQKFKVGQKVKITKSFVDKGDGFEFLSDMNNEIGREGEILELDSSYYLVETDIGDWYWPEECLELVTEDKKLDILDISKYELSPDSPATQQECDLSTENFKFENGKWVEKARLEFLGQGVSVTGGGESKKESYLKFHKECCDKMVEITRKKNEDYTGTSDDPFANFSLVEKCNIISTEKGFLTRMMDKIARINSYIDKGELLVKDESVEDTLLDLANYSLLFAGYIRSKKINKS